MVSEGVIGESWSGALTCEWVGEGGNPSGGIDGGRKDLIRCKHEKSRIHVRIRCEEWHNGGITRTKVKVGDMQYWRVLGVERLA